MTNFDKDAWIKRALAARHIVAREDGTVWRHALTLPEGRRLYKKIQVSTHQKTGRVYFTLTFEGISKSVLVNRVIGLALIPNPLNLPEVNHIDGVKAHNWKTNLEWSNRSEQEKHAHATGLKASRGSSNANAKLTVSQVEMIRAASQDTLAQIAISLNVSMKCIKDVRDRKTWKHV